MPTNPIILIFTPAAWAEIRDPMGIKKKVQLRQKLTITKEKNRSKTHLCALLLSFWSLFDFTIRCPSLDNHNGSPGCNILPFGDYRPAFSANSTVPVGRRWVRATPLLPTSCLGSGTARPDTRSLNTRADGLCRRTRKQKRSRQ